MNTLILFHANCADGFGAAVVARHWLTLKDPLLKSNPLFYAVQYGDSPPDVSECNAYILDFSFPREELLRMHEQANSLVVIDHHKTAQADLDGLDFCHFDLSKSGAVMTWNYFFPNEPMPPLLEFLQDRDLWKWELNNSREISAAIRSYPFDFDLWTKWLINADSVISLIPEGRAILRYQEQCIIAAAARPPEMVEIGGYTVPCVNCTHLISEIGNELAQGQPFAALYFDTADGKRVFSLRSTDDGIDVAEIAKQYGGGGHRNAAGFSIDKPPVL